MASKSLKTVQCPISLLCSEEHPHLQLQSQPSSVLRLKLALPGAKAMEKKYRKMHRNHQKYILRYPDRCLSCREIDPISFLLWHSPIMQPALGRLGCLCHSTEDFPTICMGHTSTFEELCHVWLPLGPPTNSSASVVLEAWANDLSADVRNTHLALLHTVQGGRPVRV